MHCAILSIIIISLDIAKRYFVPSVPVLWNSLPSNLRHIAHHVTSPPVSDHSTSLLLKNPPLSVFFSSCRFKLQVGARHHLAFRSSTSITQPFVPSSPTFIESLRRRYIEHTDIGSNTDEIQDGDNHMPCSMPCFTTSRHPHNCYESWDVSRVRPGVTSPKCNFNQASSVLWHEWVELWRRRHYRWAIYSYQIWRWLVK